MKEDFVSRFVNQRVIITGAAAGLGQVIATSFAREGADIAVLDFQRADQTRELVEKEGRRCQVFHCDVRDEHAVEEGVSAAARFFDGRVDVLVNNAGFNGHYNLVKDMPLAQWRETLDINLTGTMLVTRAVLPLMIAAKRGTIVTTASNVARRGLPLRADYVCSKWALLGLTQTLALENAEHGIRVNAVCPGPVEGDRIEDVMAHHAQKEGKSIAQVRREWESAAPMNRFVTPQEVANTMLFLASPDSSAMTGQALNVTGGFLMT
ncbi:SDR family NAD(P)-dependent oxidoreductase [Caballeronia sp. LZ008]|uniref:SDR family NAD(P)-dependent oxidoreductase n=1 Tax=unclassified Caballeronia TaxID=2646786 RepID=UPI002028B7EA|nr:MULTISPECIES: SDR family NAD(P)-dependent oxidoreductase [unclassified Caballeronia]MDR5794934.1 SDR family NAD(P)-dependent oxidoreductase [Caballeronia sp. LZ008]